ncbi:MAG: hypothetical protein KGK14_12170 [Bacteroidota bacterium]|nr:hypothetical protein [Bacteroidota bacterium]
MAIKLKQTGILLILVLGGCAPTRHSKSNDFFVKEEDYVKSYKVAFICGCINEGTKENLTKFITDNNDLGLFSEAEFISHQRVNEADSVGRIYSKRLKPLDYADAGNRTPYISGCIYFALGNEVDKIAKKVTNLIQKKGINTTLSTTYNIALLKCRLTEAVFQLL